MFIVANLILIFFTLTNDLFLQKTFLSIILCLKKKHLMHNFLFKFFFKDCVQLNYFFYYKNFS